MTSDTTNELRQNLEKLELPKMVIWVDDELKVETNHLTDKTIDEILELLAAQKQRWEAAARKDELEHTITTDDGRIFYTPDPSNPRFGEDNDISLYDRIAALDGEMTKEVM